MRGKLSQSNRDGGRHDRLGIERRRDELGLDRARKQPPAVDARVRELYARERRAQLLPAGSNPRAPAFRAAQAKCQKLLPGGAPPGPGSATHPSAQTLAKLVSIARCMREHGVPQFPDPSTSVPSNPGGVQEITDFDGAILLFPSTINLQAPAYRRALTACGAPPLGLPH